MNRGWDIGNGRRRADENERNDRLLPKQEGGSLSASAKAMGETAAGASCTEAAQPAEREGEQT